MTHSFKAGDKVHVLRLPIYADNLPNAKMQESVKTIRKVGSHWVQFTSSKTFFSVTSTGFQSKGARYELIEKLQKSGWQIESSRSEILDRNKT